MEIIIKVNGRRIAEQIEPDLLLIDFLRKHGCYSVKRGCETANAIEKFHFSIFLPYISYLPGQISSSASVALR